MVGEGSLPRQPAFIFDLGGVLVDWNPRHLYRKVFDEAELAFFLDRVCPPQWNLTLDAGRPFGEAILEKQAQWPDYAQAIGWWKTRWLEMLAGPFPETVELLAGLRKAGHPLFALTNWSSETFPLAKDRFDFFGWFGEIVVSGEVGLTKPDPAIFRLTAARCGIPLEGTVFIDDAQVNVDAARSLGLDAIRFTGAPDIRAALAERGYLQCRPPEVYGTIRPTPAKG